MSLSHSQLIEALDRELRRCIALGLPYVLTLQTLKTLEAKK